MSEMSSSIENEGHQNDLMIINLKNQFTFLCVSYIIHFADYSRPRNILKMGKSYFNYYLELPMSNVGIIIVIELG